VLVVGDVEEDDALGARGARPVAAHRLDRHATRRDVDDAIGAAADQARDPLHGAAEPRDRHRRVGQHREQRRIRLHEHDVHRAAIGGADFLDDAGHAAEQRGPRRRRRRGIVLQMTGEARGDFGGRDRRPIVKGHTIPKRERPGQPITGDGPACGQRGLDVRRAEPIRDQGVEHLPREQRNRAVERARGIEQPGHRRDADAQLAAPLRAAVGEERT